MKKKKIRLRWDNIFKDIIGILVICAICWAVYVTAEPINKNSNEGVVQVIIRTDDPVRDFHRHDAEQQKELEKLPRCSMCDEYIQDDYLYEINDEVICEECINQNFRKRVEDYVE